MRTVDNAAIAAAAATHFRSEYDYAVFEYLRSAKVIEALERAGIALSGRLLDAGCGGGGTALSLAEEGGFAVGLDLDARFRGAGTRLAAERSIARAGFVQGDGQRLPFRDESFDVVFSHSVIEHVARAGDYLLECHRVLRPGGHLYLSTAPFLSLPGAHLPTLRLPVPLHLLLGRRAAFRVFCWLAAHAPWSLREPREANTFIALAERGRRKQDDLLQRVTLGRLARWLRAAGFENVSEDRYVTGFFRRFLPGPLRRFCASTPWLQDVLVGHVQCVLRKVDAARTAS